MKCTVRPVQNGIPVTIRTSKSKLEVKLQYDGRLFSETRNSNTSSKFGVQMAVV